MTMFRSSQMPLWSQKETYFSWDVNFKIYFNFTDTQVFMKIQVEWNIDITHRDLNLIRDDVTLPVSTVVWHTIKRMGQLSIFSQGCPVQRGWFEWGPDEKEKQHKRQQQIKNGCSTKYSKSIGGSIWLGLKCLLGPNPNLFKSCSLLSARGSIMSQVFNYF